MNFGLVSYNDLCPGSLHSRKNSSKDLTHENKGDFFLARLEGTGIYFYSNRQSLRTYFGKNILFRNVLTLH